LRVANHAIPIAAPLQFPHVELPVDPYVLGAWLGDGASRGAEYSSADPEIIDHIQAAGYRVTKLPAECKYYIGAYKNRPSRSKKGAPDKCLSAQLRALGVRNNKHIPDVYLRASVAQRRDLLAGLMDTDGSIDAAGTCTFVNTNRRLVEQTRDLVLGLGIECGRIRTRRARIGTKDYGEVHTICFTPEQPVFRLTRKRARQRPGRSTRAFRYIVDVRPRPSVAVRCIQVDSPSHLFLAGRECVPTHNTRTGAEWIRSLVESGRASRVALVAATAADARDVVVEGESGLLAISPPWNRPLYEPSRRRLTWRNGAIASLYSADEPDRLRGPQHDAAWTDELAAWRYPEAWDQLMFGLRLGTDPRVVVTTTPRPTPLIRQLISLPTTVVTRGTTYENRAHLAEAFYESIVRQYEGTRLGQQELLAELLDDNPGALFRRNDIESGRVREAPPLVRIVVAIDPAVSHGESANETGIVVVGLGVDGHAYILSDLSGRLSPYEWARAAVDAYHGHRADRIVAEKNQGGALVESNLRTVDPRIPYKGVTATRGKTTRAEPVAALYEQGRVHHVGCFPKLEDQMCAWDPSGQVARSRRESAAASANRSTSPDRMDALVWGLTELLVEAQPVIRDFDNLPPA
jgi:phage terminase large subunit-like protein